MSTNNVDTRFEFAQSISDDIKDEVFKGEAISFFKDAMLRFRKNKASISATVVIVFIILMAFIGPILSSYGWNDQNPKLQYLPPRIPQVEKLGICDGVRELKVKKQNFEMMYKDSTVEVLEEYLEKGIPMVRVNIDMYKLNGVKDRYYWFGTDYLGRSSWTRLWKGTRISLLIALISVSTNLVIGIIYGSISGYFGGKVDMIMQRFSEFISSIPLFVLTILFIMYYGSGLIPIAMSLVISGWIGTSMIIRSQFYRYKGHEYVLASRTMGAPDRTLIFRHILPNAIGPVITSASLAIPFAIFNEAGLAYLGLGLQAPKPSMGVLLSEGQRVLLTYPYLILFPGIVMSVLMVCFNLLGNGLRDAFNPTLRGVE